jgi:hypothetical protein
MKTILTLITILGLFSRSFAQQPDLVKTADSLSAEGDQLYKSEWASWYGSDIFEAQCKDKRILSGGYISYDTGKGLNNIFFSKGDNPVVLATISFEYGFNTQNYKLDTTSRKLSKSELELYTFRKKAVSEIYKDTLFKRFNNTSLNPIPIISNHQKKVYFLTGPVINGVVLFGNDYLVTFDKDNNITSKRKLHRNLISIPYSKTETDPGKIAVATIHSHSNETGEFITATDICTLRLYEKFTTWEQHLVISKDYVSLWNCKNDTLLILTAEAWKKIYSGKDTSGNTTY